VAVNALGVAGLLPLSIIPGSTCTCWPTWSALRLAAALGACCSTPQDAQNLAIVLLMPCIIPLLMLMPVLRQPNGMIATVMSLVPPFTRSSCYCARPCPPVFRRGNRGWG